MSRLLYLHRHILSSRSQVVVSSSSSLLLNNNNNNINNNTMKFSNAVLTCLVLATPASAWTSRSTSVRGFRSSVAAVQLHASSSTPAASISTESAGEAATESFRLKFKDGDKPLSPWHDIALKNADGSYNMVSYVTLRYVTLYMHTCIPCMHSLVVARYVWILCCVSPMLCTN
jgi:hypothetical protein